ncbi:MAG: HAMP domain-containing sensor histidine kinase [Arenibacter latericius]|nr:HAMP domain-containing sensor histidine kinase [Arenibacter latericius]
MGKEIKELREEKKRLQEEIELKKGWISLLSHDFKEVFGNLLWLIQSLESEFVSKEDFFNLWPRITKDAEKSLQTVNDTSTWLKTQLDKYKPQKTELTAYDLFIALKEGSDEALTEKKIDFTFKGDESLTFSNDSFLILFILKKLVNNAIKFSESGKSVDFEVLRSENDIVISVIDYGLGMGKETQKLLYSFEGPVFQGTNGEVGAGLSLIIVQQFLSLLQGEMEVVSTEHKGTKVTIAFPEITT